MKFMNKVNLKSQNSSLKSLKSSLACYDVSENRFFESSIKKIGNNTSLDFGLKHTFRSHNSKLESKSSNLTISRLKNFETPYNDILCDIDAYRKIQVNNELLNLFKEKFNSKSFLKGRLLNGTKRGFSIGVAGIVGFLSLNNTVKINKDKTVILYVDFININQAIINLSQKNIHKKTNKILLKLASRIVFIFESNSKKK
jgi:hypothetical protein